MFEKLKNRLKDVLGVFSKKTIEQAEPLPAQYPPELSLPLQPTDSSKQIVHTSKNTANSPKHPAASTSPNITTISPLPSSSLQPTISDSSSPPAADSEQSPSAATRPGLLEKVKLALTTKTISREKFEELFWAIELVLLESNVSVEVIEKIKSDLEHELVQKPLPRNVEGKIKETLKSTLAHILTAPQLSLTDQVKKSTKRPFVIAFFGINGTGKTTSIAKLAHLFQKHHLTVVLAACDTFRAAAIQQLEEHAHRLNTKIIRHDYGSDAAAVAFDALRFAEKNHYDVVLIDTAGRLHSNTNLMAELGKIIRITKPDLKIFVGESITGNDCIEQARQFNELVDMDGCILTKADVDDKGGTPISISYVIGKPIYFLGIGQDYDDFEPFSPSKIISSVGL